MKRKKLNIKTVNISIPKEVLEKFDKVCEKMHWDRSTLIRLAVEFFMQTNYLPGEDL